MKGLRVWLGFSILERFWYFLFILYLKQTSVLVIFSLITNLKEWTSSSVFIIYDVVFCFQATNSPELSNKNVECPLQTFLWNFLPHIIRIHKISKSLFLHNSSQLHMLTVCGLKWCLAALSLLVLTPPQSAASAYPEKLVWGESIRKLSPWMTHWKWTWNGRFMDTSKESLYFKQNVWESIHEFDTIWVILMSTRIYAKPSKPEICVLSWFLLLCIVLKPQNLRRNNITIHVSRSIKLSKIDALKWQVFPSSNFPNNDFQNKVVLLSIQRTYLINI